MTPPHKSTLQSTLQSTLKTTLLASFLLAGCVADADLDPQHDTAQGKADQISGNDDPSGVLGNAERRLAQLISSEDIGQSFGVEPENMPYPDTYWPMVENGIAVEWLEKSGGKCSTQNDCSDPEDSPLSKFVKLTRPNDLTLATEWEIKNHGKDVPDVADWFGHCPGWVAGAMLNKPILHPVHAKANGQGGVQACEEGEEGCTKFEIGDINALTAEAHEGARSLFIGARCDTKPEDIERDDFGRIVRNGKGCKGLNAGSMLIVMANRLKNEKKPFAIDAQNEFNTEQIWNQPAFRYTVNRYETVSEAEAANLVATGDRTGEQTEYQWNDNANGFAFVDVSLHWVTETGPNTTVIAGSSSSKTTRMVAVIELDRASDDSEAKIIGGEYIDDPRVGANRLRVAPFVWIAQGMNSDWRHNPYIRGTAVQQLIDMGTKPLDAPVDPTTECEHSMCSEGGVLEASCDTCVASICAADPYCCNNSWDNICVGEVASVCNQDSCQL